MRLKDVKALVARFKGYSNGHINDGTMLIIRMDDGTRREVRDIRLTSDGYSEWFEVLIERRGKPVVTNNGCVTRT